MLIENINLSEKYPDVRFLAYIHEESSDPRVAVVICPGGGYSGVCFDREGERIAEHYCKAGFNAFILDYYVGKKITNLEPTIQVALAVKHVRENATKYNVDPQKIVTCGFSAGGHLAGSAGILYNLPEVRDAIGVTDGSAPEGINRPNGMILSYPVVTAGPHCHRGSFVNLTRDPNYGEDQIQKLSLEKNVDSTTPPMFIWHTVTDNCVPIHNAIMLVNAYLENNRPFEAHIYPNGPHGMALCTAECSPNWPEAVDPHVATWADLSVMWINDTFNK